MPQYKEQRKKLGGGLKRIGKNVGQQNQCIILGNVNNKERDCIMQFAPKGVHGSCGYVRDKMEWKKVRIIYLRVNDIKTQGLELELCNKL